MTSAPPAAAASMSARQPHSRLRRHLRRGRVSSCIPSFTPSLPFPGSGSQPSPYDVITSHPNSNQELIAPSKATYEYDSDLSDLPEDPPLVSAMARFSQSEYRKKLDLEKKLDREMAKQIRRLRREKRHHARWISMNQQRLEDADEGNNTDTVTDTDTDTDVDTETGLLGAGQNRYPEPEPEEPLKPAKKHTVTVRRWPWRFTYIDPQGRRHALVDVRSDEQGLRFIAARGWKGGRLIDEGGRGRIMDFKFAVLV